MKNFNLLIAALLFVTALSCSSDNNQNASENEAVNIVATTGMIADAARVIGGDKVEVKGLMGPGVDPHLYKASAGDVALLSNADLILYNGLHLEGKMSEIFEQMKKRGIETVAVAEVIDQSALLPSPDYEGQYDPHVWFDVDLWKMVVSQMRDSLVEKDPENADVYNSNAGEYLAELTELNEYVETKTASLPENKRVLITAHDAFNYFGNGYGFEVKGLQGISTDAEAGTADVQELAAFIVERQLPAVFVESSVPPKYIEAVQAAVKARGYNVEVGGEIYSDAMGSPGTPEGNYVGMVRHNIDTIVGALNKGGES